MLGCGMLLAVAAVQAEDNPARANSSRAAREAAIELIPWDKIARRDQARIETVLEKTSLFRRMPTQVIRCDPELYQFTVDNPEILVNIWHLLGLEDITLERQSERMFRAADGAGTLGEVHVVYADQHLRVVYGEGTYDGPMFPKPVRGSCVLLLESDYQRDEHGYDYVCSRLHVFMRLEQVSLDLLAKTFQPLVGKVADFNFEQTSLFVQSLSRAAEANPRGMERLAAKLTDVSPELRGRFVQVTARVAARGDQRRTLAARITPNQTGGE
ncbi:MAG: hypothetical protein K1X74_17670 [Pirellulales bacterium]|nr:hypothetical protein [Pirellulales bacterium]